MSRMFQARQHISRIHCAASMLGALLAVVNAATNVTVTRGGENVDTYHSLAVSHTIGSHDWWPGGELFPDLMWTSDDGSVVLTIDRMWAGPIGGDKQHCHLSAWDGRTGKKRFDRLLESFTWAVGMSPKGDMILTAHGNVLRSWDPLTGRELWSVETPHSPISRIDVEPDGKRLTCFIGADRVVVWDLAKQETLFELPGLTRNAVLAPESDSLYVFRERFSLFVEPRVRSVRIEEWDVVRQEMLRSLELGDKFTCSPARISGDGRLLAYTSLSDTNKAFVYSLADFGEVKELEFDEDIGVIRFAPNHRDLIVGLRGGGVYRHELETGERRILRRPSVLKPGATFGADGFTPVSITSDGSKVYGVGGFTRAIEVWDLERGEPISDRGPAFDSASIEFFPDGERLAAVGCDGMVRIWTTSEGNVRLLSSEQILGRSLGNGKGQIAIRQNGKRLIVGEDEIWTQELGKNEWQRKKKKPSFGPVQMAVSASGDLVAVGHDFASDAVEHGLQPIELYRTKDDWALSTLSPKLFYLSALTLSPNGKSLAFADESERIHVWDVEEKRETAILSTDHHEFESIQWTPGGERLASVGLEGRVNIWDTKANRLSRTLETDQNYTCCEFLADGAAIALGRIDGTLEIRNMETGRLVFNEKRHDRRINDIAVAPNGRRIATASADGMILIWDVVHKR